MNDRIQMMLDHFEIREVLEAYVHACDRSDLEGFLRASGCCGLK